MSFFRGEINSERRTMTSLSRLGDSASGRVLIPSTASVYLTNSCLYYRPSKMILIPGGYPPYTRDRVSRSLADILVLVREAVALDVESCRARSGYRPCRSRCHRPGYVRGPGTEPMKDLAKAIVDGGEHISGRTRLAGEGYKEQLELK